MDIDKVGSRERSGDVMSSSSTLSSSDVRRPSIGLDKRIGEENLARTQSMRGTRISRVSWGTAIERWKLQVRNNRRK